MADLVSGDLTLTLQDPPGVRIIGRQRKTAFKVAFGDGAKTYPAGGVPTPTFSSFGMYRQVDYLNIIEIDSTTGLVWKWDFANKKFRAWQSKNTAPTAANAAHAHDLVFKANAAANAVTMAANSLRNATAGDLTVTGGGADGGIGNATPAITVTKAAAETLIELGNVAVAATTLYVIAYGW